MCLCQCACLSLTATREHTVLTVLCARCLQVINHLNEMLNSFQLGGGGVGWASPLSPNTPLATRRSQHTPSGHVSHGGHFVYHGEDSSLPDTAAAVDDIINSEQRQKSSVGVTGRARDQQKYQSLGRTPESHVNASALTDREDTPYSRQRNTRRTSPEDGTKSLLPAEGLNLAPVGGHVADHSPATKSYYEGLLDIPWDSGAHRKGHQTGAPRTHPTTPPTHSVPGRLSDSFPPSSSRSGKKAMYSWQLDDFGRSDE